MDPNRRTALKVLATAGVAAAGASTQALARAPKQVPPEAMGMLYDTTRCIGCKTCVVACLDANGLEADRSGIPGELHHAPVDLNGRTKNIIKLYKDGERTSYFKAQCMHCIDPACASACMLHSLSKNPVTGVVEYDPTWCVGCRYCQMSCPFNVPKFEFDKALPLIVKCELCRHRVKDAAAVTNGFTRYPKGQGPACCEVCPREAVIYGKRDELLAEARRRIAASPGKYFEDRVYGENDGGGTQVLYLAHVPFGGLGLPDLGSAGVPHTAYTVQEGIYYQIPFAAPVGMFAVLAAVIYRNRRAEKVSEAEGEAGR